MKPHAARSSARTPVPAAPVRQAWWSRLGLMAPRQAPLARPASPSAEADLVQRAREAGL